MSRVNVDDVRYRIARSQEALRVGEGASHYGELHEAVGRLYYACFHLVSALPSIEGHRASTHRGISTLFDLHWIKPGRLPLEFGQYHHRIHERRQEADYAMRVTFTLEEVEDWFAFGREFLAALQAEIVQLLPVDM